MAYDQEEKRQYGAEPLECYFFELGASSWSYTSADQPITIPGWTDQFQPAPIIASHEEHGPEDSAGGIVLRVPRALPCIADFVPYIPSESLTLTVIRLHRTPVIEAITPFMGVVVNVGWEEHGVAKLTCRPITTEFGRQLAGLSYQRQCN